MLWCLISINVLQEFDPMTLNGAAVINLLTYLWICLSSLKPSNEHCGEWYQCMAFYLHPL